MSQANKSIDDDDVVARSSSVWDDPQDGRCASFVRSFVRSVVMDTQEGKVFVAAEEDDDDKRQTMRKQKGLAVQWQWQCSRDNQCYESTSTSSFVHVGASVWRCFFLGDDAAAARCRMVSFGVVIIVVMSLAAGSFLRDDDFVVVVEVVVEDDANCRPPRSTVVVVG